jgi:methyl-accepting chemotaxis protein
MQHSIRQKIVFYSGICLFSMMVIITMVASISLFTSARKARRMAVESGHIQCLASAREVATNVRAELELALDASRAFADMLTEVHQNGRTQLSREDVEAMMAGFVEQNPQFIGISTGWEPNAFDGNDKAYVNKPGHDATGRFVPYFNHGSDGKPHLEPLVDYTKEGLGDYYIIPQRTREECVIEPFLYPVNGQEVLMTSLMVPIIHNGNFLGVAGIDMPLTSLQKLAEESAKKLYGGEAEVQIVSNSGFFAGYSKDSAMIGKPMKEVHEDWEEDLALVQAAQDTTQIDEGMFFALSPIRAGSTKTAWAVIITVPEKVVTADADRLMRQSIFSIIAIVVFGFGVAAIALYVMWRLAGKIAKPIATAAAMFKDIAQGEGDLTVSLEAQSNDEIGEMAESFNIFIRKLQAIIKEVVQINSVLVHSVQELSATASEMSAGASEISSQLEVVSATSEEISSSVTTIAASSEQASANINAMAAATEQVSSGIKTMAVNAGSVTQGVEEVVSRIDKLTRNTQSTNDHLMDLVQRVNTSVAAVEEVNATLDGISSNTQNANNISHKADEFAGKTVTVMRELKQSADQIGKIIKVINDISSQTNMLALNATIEAASAGEAGKGFAVVANEVKELAKQTAEATEQISRQIENMQGSTQRSVDSIQQIADIIRNLSEINSGVAISVKELTTATNEINQTISHMASAAQNVTHIADENQKLTEQVAGNASKANVEIREIARTSEESAASAGEMARNSEQANAGAREIARGVSEINMGINEITNNLSGIAQAANESARGGRTDKCGCF